MSHILQSPVVEARDKQLLYQARVLMANTPSPPITPPATPLEDFGLWPAPTSVESVPMPQRQQQRRGSSFHRELVYTSLTGRFRTLIVDDNPININILERTLKRHFSHLVAPDIKTASSGNAALCQLSPQTMIPPDDIFAPLTAYCNKCPKQIVRQQFDLILLDIDMPDLSGVQVAEQIRKVHQNHITAIVAVTTSTLPEQQRIYEKVGMDGVVGKPINLQVLDQVVTKALLARQYRRTVDVNGGLPGL
jgi:CheY-like chemotaxis protein